VPGLRGRAARFETTHQLLWRQPALSPAPLPASVRHRELFGDCSRLLLCSYHTWAFAAAQGLNVIAANPVNASAIPLYIDTMFANQVSLITAALQWFEDSHACHDGTAGHLVERANGQHEFRPSLLQHG
jgi:hypothetical protein